MMGEVRVKVAIVGVFVILAVMEMMLVIIAMRWSGSRGRTKSNREICGGIHNRSGSNTPVA